MRRNDKQITDFEKIEEVIRKCRVCRLGLSHNDRPYIIPINFGYRDKTLYFHSAREGTKVDILKKNPNICFEFDIDLGTVRNEDSGCNWSNRYQSVIGFGKIAIVEGVEQKRDALDILMKNYSDTRFDYPYRSLENTLVFKVDIESMTGKQSI
ncbi:MAG: pyridoxamine 5'-phosphate oxidase family protein [Desulfuromonas sp.]|nr:MAG: pyridoxamine 5'-phosphate oxidase family protein [Desulfuromonas sp.]